MIFSKAFSVDAPFRGTLSGLENIILQFLSLLQVFHERGNLIHQHMYYTTESIQYLLSFVSWLSLCVQNSVVKSGADRQQAEQDVSFLFRSMTHVHLLILT